MRFLWILVGITIMFIGLGMESVYAQQDDLVLWLSFTGAGNTASDRSGNGNHGTIVGATRAPGKSGQGISIGLKDEYVEIPEVLTPAGTIEFWFKPNWDGTIEETYRLFDATIAAKAWSIGKGKGS